MEDEIKYYEESSWQKYFAVDVAELYSSVKRVLKLRDEIKRTFGGKRVGELITSNVYKEMLFGGFRAEEDKPFSDNALAHLYSECFGLKVAEEDVDRIISRMRGGMPLEEACGDISCTVEETDFISILWELSGKLESIYGLLKEVTEPPEKEEVEISDSMVGVDVIRRFLNACKRLLPLYNPMSFFVMSVYSLPIFYAKETYTRLFEDEVQALLRKFGINLTTLLELDTPDEQLREKWRIIGLEKGCVGWIMRDILLHLYQVFQQECLKRFFEIDNEFVVYVREYTRRMKESLPYTDRFSQIIDAIKSALSRSYYDWDRKRCEISEFAVYTSGGSEYCRGKIVGGVVKIREKKVDYIEFFAFLAPLMFSGLAYIEPVSSKEFEWTCILGWE